jgi:hypothetical protein
MTGTVVRRTLAAAAAATASLALASSAHAAAWSGLGKAADADNATLGTLAVDRAGDVFVAYSIDASGKVEPDVHMAERPAGTTSWNDQVISTTTDGARLPQIATDPAGDLAVAWQEGGVRMVAAARAASATSFTSPQTLSTNTAVPPGVPPALAMDRDGDVAVAWPQDSIDDDFPVGDWRLYGSVRPAGGSFTTASEISSGSAAGYADVNPSIGIDATGNAVVAWSHKPSSCNPNAGECNIRWTVEDGTLSNAGTGADDGLVSGPAGPTQGYPECNGDASTQCISPTVAVDGAGDATVAWVAADVSTGHSVVRVAYDGARSTVSRATDASDIHPALAGDSNGDAVIAWTHLVFRTGGGDDTSIEADRRSGPTGGFTALVDPGAADGSDLPAVGIDTVGDAVLAWGTPDGIGGFDVDAATLPAGAGLDAAQPLGAAGTGTPAINVVMNELGDAAVSSNVANDNGRGDNEIDAWATGRPRLSPISVSGTETTGRPLTFGATADDPYSGLTTEAWDFGDGAHGSGESPTHTYTTPGPYDATFTATDQAGNSRTESVHVTIAPAATPTPTPTPGPSATPTPTPSPTPQPTPTPTPTQGTAHSAGAIHVSGHRVLVPLRCAGGTPCHVTAKLLAGHVTVGTLRATLATGAHRRLTLALNRRGRRLLRSHHTLRLHLTVRQGATTVASRRLTMRR